MVKLCTETEENIKVEQTLGEHNLVEHQKIESNMEE